MSNAGHAGCEFTVNRTEMHAQSAGGDYVCELCAIRSQKRKRLDHLLDTRILPTEVAVQSPYFQKGENPSVQNIPQVRYPEVTENSNDGSTHSIPVPNPYSTQTENSSGDLDANVPVPIPYLDQAENSQVQLTQGDAIPGTYVEQGENSQEEATQGIPNTSMEGEENDNLSEDMLQSVTTQVGELFHCGICGKDFGHKSHFKRHLASHTGEKTHTCEVCGQSFSGHLARHMRTHSAVKQYMCHVCKKGFNRGEHLKRHLRTHEHQLGTMASAWYGRWWYGPY